METIADAVEMPEHCRQRQLALKTYYSRLEAWGKVVGLIKADEGQDFSLDLGTDQITIYATLSEIRALLDAFVGLEGRYTPLQQTAADLQREVTQAQALTDYTAVIRTMAPQHPTNRAPTQQTRLDRIKTKLSHAWSGTKNLVLHLTNLRWTLVDEDFFDDLLTRLETLLSYLEGSLTGYRAQILDKMVRQSALEIVQTHRNVDSLVQQLASLTLVLCSDSQPSQNSLHAVQKDILEELVRLRVLSSQPTSASISLFRLQDLHRAYLKAADQVDYTQQPLSPANVQGTFDPRNNQSIQNIWIEWKYWESGGLASSATGGPPVHIPKPETDARTAELSAMLHLSRTDDFCTPNCIGYFNDADRRGGPARFGWIFEIPNRYKNEMPTSLLKLYTDLPRPSITIRMRIASKLASSLLYIHAANWVHKELRSENVICFRNPDGSFDLRNVKVTGYAFARTVESKTTRTARPDPPLDMYRWPTAQASQTNRAHARKTFDIYALGLIMIELAHWQPLHQILGFDTAQKVTKADAEGIRQLLLRNPRYLSAVSEVMGEKYTAVVRKCLDGASAFGVGDNDDQKGLETSLRIQKVYNEQLVLQLKSLDI